MRVSTGLRWLLLGVLAVVACSSRSDEAVSRTSQALSTTGRVLSFEQPTADWTATNLNLQQGNQFVDGAHSAAVTVLSSGGKLTSIPLASLGPISSTVTLQVRVPSYVASPTWQGQVALWLNSPTAGVWDQYFGPVAFQNSPVGTFHQIQFTLPPAIVNALSTSTYSDLTVSVELDFNPNPNSGAAASDPFYIDKLDFGQSAPVDGGAGGSSSGAGGTTGGGGVSGVAGAGGAGAGGTAGTAGASAGRSGGGASGAAGSAGAAGVSGATSGPCAFTAPSPSPTSDVQFSIKLPRGVRREDIAIGTTGGYLTLDDGVRVIKDTGGFASVSNVAATNRASLGVSAEVQDIYSELTGIDLRSNAHVHGVAKTAADVATQAGAVVDGATSPGANLEPLESVTWTASFPTANRGSCSLEPDNTEVIEPGSYGDVAVKSRSHLKIRSGTYFFNSLSFEPEAFLDIANTAGPIFVYIRTTFAFSGTVAETDPTRMNFLFGVAGNGNVNIQSAFRGILVAPSAGVNLPTSSNVGHVGAFFANALIAHQNTNIHLRPFAPSEFCASDAPCSSFCPCGDNGGVCGGTGSSDEPATADPSCVDGNCCPAGANVVTLTSGADTNSNSTPNVCLVALDGSDTLFSAAAGVTVMGGTGDDTIASGQFSPPGTGVPPVRIFGGPGNDTINGWFDGAQIYGGPGDDTISAGPGPVLIAPGSGVDNVSSGDGDDTFVLYAECEATPGKKLDAQGGFDTLISPLSIDELRARGVTVDNFEKVIIQSDACKSDCATKPNCGAQSQCADRGGQAVCGSATGSSCTTCSDCVPGLSCSGGTCQQCVPNCAGKQCGDDLSNGCGGTCEPVCGGGDVGCITSGDCQSGLQCATVPHGATTQNVCIVPGKPCESASDCATGEACGHQNGPSFGQDSATNICEPNTCLSIDRAVNPCLNPANAGKQTACGACPVCVPQCDVRSCGDDHCGGTCGSCGDGGTCLGGSCLGTTRVLSNLPTGPLPRSGFPFPPQQLGTVPGLIPATFSVNASGQATYHIPLDVAPGRGGLQPDLALDYNSGQGNGVLGVGWSLEGLSVISRCDKTVAQDNLASTPVFNDDSNDPDALCLDGKRLLVVSSDGDRVEYRTEIEEFSKIIRNSNSSGYESFLVLTKSGRTLEFGNTTDSRIPIPAGVALGQAVGGIPDSGIVSMSYLLDKVTDLAGNTIQYQYDPRVSADAGYEYLITNIVYGWHDDEPAPSAPVEVVFNYKSRDDTLSGWKYGARQNVNDLIDSIDVAVGSGTFRRYAMTYQIEGLPTSDGSRVGRSILTDVTECARTPSMAGWDLQQAACKTPIHFEYSDPRVPSSASLIPTPFTLLDTPVNFQKATGAGDTPAITGYALDLNGDGRTDFLIPEWHRPDFEGATRDEHCQPFPQGHSDNVGRGSCYSEWVVMWAQPDGTFTSTETGIPLVFQYPFFMGPQDSDWFSRICHGTGIVTDLNGDGLDELIETDCDDEGHDQHSYSAIAFVNGALQRVDLPNVPLGGLGSTGPTVGANSEINDTPIDSAAAYLLDADGDGAPDLLECHALGLSGGSVWTLYHNTHAARLNDSFSEGHRVDIHALCGSTYGSHTVVDVDGDGRDELILRVNEGTPGTQRIVRFTGQGVESQDGETNLSLLERIPNEPSYRTLDINGDGLVDFMSAFGKIDISRGDGTFDKFTQPVIDVGWGMDGNNLAANRESVFRQAVPVDVDGDGMQDLVVPGKDRWVWLRSTGTGFVLKEFPTLMPVHTQNDALETFFQTALLADVDGDSYPDIVQLRRSDVGTTPELEPFPVLHFTGPAQPEVIAITDSLDARTEVHYSHLKDTVVYTPGAGCVYPQHCEGPTPRRVVAKVDSWDKHQHPSDNEFTLPAKETTYQYSDGRLDLPRRAWLGFSDRESRESVDPGTPAAQLVSQISEFFDLDTYDPTAHLYPFAHQPRETDSTAEIGAESGRFRRTKTTNLFASRTENTKGIFAWTASNVSNVFEGTSFLDEVQISDRIVNVDPPDQYGNVTHSTQSSSDSGGLLESRDVTTSFEWQFQTLATPWQISQVRQRRETSTVPATGLSKTRQEVYSYFPNGLLHTDTRGTTEAEGRTTTLGRDAYGNITSIVAHDDAGNSRSVTVGYDLLGFAPTTLTNGNGHITKVVVDARFGSITHIVDPNNLISDTWFDNFGRTELQVAPDGTTKSISYQFGPFVQLRPTRIQTSESGGETITTDLDVLGREIHTERTGLGGTLIAQSQSFDSRGFPQKVEWPHKDAVTEPKTSLSVFDNLGRITALVQPVGTTSSCYENRTSCQTNAVGYTTCKITDALGRLVASVDPHAGDPEDCQTALAAAPSRPATTYAYGPFGDLSSVKDVNGNVTTIETDNYGRKTAMADPDSGQRTFQYNGLDDLTRAEDANGNIVAYIRDAIGRVKQRQETRDFHPEIPERDTNWTWDGDGSTTTDALVGALTQVVTPEGHTETYHYDRATGRLKSREELVAGSGGGTFSVSFDYDVNGLIQNVNYPRVAGQHDVTVHHNYDAFGHLIGLTDPTQVISGRPFWSINPSTATDDYEQLTHETFGNGVQTSVSYTPDGWVEDIQNAFNNSALQHVHYSLDADGNVLNRQDLVRTQWESFAYDHMGRLGCSLVGSNTDPAALSPTCTGTPTASYSHDDLGRITGSLGAGSYSYPLASAAAHPVHAPTSVGDTTYTYDNNGNRARQIDGAGNARGFSWTAFNKPLETWREGATPSDKLDLVHLEYDANQTRVKKETATLITAYLDGLYEQRTSKTGGATEHVFYLSNGASVVAQITQTAGQTTDTVQYLQSDSLGSAQLLTNSAGTVLEERSYDAFGQARSAENWAQNLTSGGVLTNNTSGFTGQERDDEFGLVNMRGREYDPRIGQFLQADPVVQDPTRSQFLNRYSYVTNNPLKFADPTGYQEQAAQNSDGTYGQTHIHADGPNPVFIHMHTVGPPAHHSAPATAKANAPPQGASAAAPPAPASAAPSLDPKAPGADNPGAAFSPLPVMSGNPFSPADPSVAGSGDRFNPYDSVLPGTSIFGEPRSGPPPLQYHAITAQSFLSPFLGWVSRANAPEPSSAPVPRTSPLEFAIAILPFFLGPEADASAPGAYSVAAEGAEAVSKLGGESYEILDGVRRAKAAAELGQETIAAEVQIGGRTVASGEVPISSLLSPNKSVIDVSTQSAMQRWLNVLNGTRAGDSLPPIIIQPGARGVPIPGVGFQF